jgi:glyoxylase I family protein
MSGKSATGRSRELVFVRLTHIGLCVSDLERSIRFYTEALGFAEDARRPPLSMQGGLAADLLGIPDVALEAVYLVKDGMTLELLAYPSPGVVGDAEPCEMNRLGFTHLSVAVDDLDAAAARIAAAGGRLLEESRIPVAIFALDPDGTRIELVAVAGR